MKMVIINADDLGFSRANNEAIIECYSRGCVTGVSLMPTGQCFQEAVDMLKAISRTEVGVHLALTGDMEPVVKKEGISSLPASGAKFRGDYISFAAGYFSGAIKRSHIYDELRSQVKKVLDTGLSITHIDGHEHIHMFPAIFKMTVDLAEEFGIPYVRIPVEQFTLKPEYFAPKKIAGYIALSAFSAVSVKVPELVSNDHFRGYFDSGNVNDILMNGFIKSLMPGVTEIAVHPYIYSPDFVSKYPWYLGSRQEFDVLMNGTWKSLLEPCGARLVTHKQAVESSR
ncbi:MAG TPA: ChbG/HpnK family deacetylase [Candidatus Omnitrophota bacterium]|nr:ChbG/HpnK family deacetylase [Candidatus Omnitrophota bacterium]HPS20516.1 ChbG/HpnK family deacetylase [Candidatus Omnitrophota bacterium]